MKALEQLQAVLGLLAVLAVSVLGLRRTFGRNRRTGTTAPSGVFEAVDEVFSPARHSSAVELRTQRQQGPVTPSPDRWPTPSLEGPYVVKGKADATSTAQPPAAGGAQESNRSNP